MGSVKTTTMDLTIDREPLRQRQGQLLAIGLRIRCSFVVPASRVRCLDWSARPRRRWAKEGPRLVESPAG